MNIIEKKQRHFVSDTLTIHSWDDISSYFEELLNRPINSLSDFQQWLRDTSELEAVIEEDAAWRYIRMTINTADEEASVLYTKFTSEIQPIITEYQDKLNRKMVKSEFSDPKKHDEAYRIYYRNIHSKIDLFRSENASLEAQIAKKSSRFGSLAGAQTILHDGKTLTMQQASMLLEEQDETLRKTIFEKITARRLQDREALDNLYSELILLRHQMAINAGCANFRDYQFRALGRFDYTKEDCFAFHRSIKSAIVPLVSQLSEKKLQKIGKKRFRPWDLSFDPEGKTPLRPFSNADELLSGTIKLLEQLDPYFGACLSAMETIKHLDLNSKPGKAPGGYNYPLYEVGIPFIFMNAVGSQRDLVTIVHEAGHAVHSFLSHELELTAYKDFPSEVAELASMSMELLTMELWSNFYDENDLKRAKKDQLETILTILPWIAQVDEFQHWIYENPMHSINERTEKWVQLSQEYSHNLIDWTDHQQTLQTQWQRQMHIFEMPFYYIEYGFAQLGAIGVWKNSIDNLPVAIQKYKNALQLGYSQSIAQIYQAAGTEFNFSENKIIQIADFISNELNKLSTNTL